jgi:hypothetical protein
MGSRERKRAERRKRKRRSGARTATADPPQGEDAAGAKAVAEEKESFQERMARRSEERNAEARAKLKPLEEGERPTAVTVGAVISAAVAVIFTVSAVVAIFSSAEIDGNEPSPLPLAIFAVPLWMMAWGMSKARYWAVLGFEMLLLLFMLASAVALVGGETVAQVAGALVLLAGSGVLFYYLIRSMARIQMPERPQGR